MTRLLDPTLDVVFKLLLGSPETKDCLIALLTAVLKPASPITDVEVLNPGLDKENIDDKGIVLDLLVRLADGTVTDRRMITSLSARIWPFTSLSCPTWAG